MRLTGEIMDSLSKNQRNFAPPTIGIATYGIVHAGDDLLARDSSRLPKLEVPYDITPPQGSRKAALDPNHNVFLLVDDGTRDKFGKEIKFRAAVESATRKRFDAPVITVVIQGGPGTLNTALEAIRENTPIVVVDKSGLAADVLAYAYHFCHSSSSKYTSHTAEGLRRLVTESFNVKDPNPAEKYRQYFYDALECVDNPHLVHVFNLQDSGPDEFENCILNAIFSNESNLQNQLKQAMFFDRPDIANKALTARRKEAFDINASLQEALVYDKPRFVELYLTHGAKISELKPRGMPEKAPGPLASLPEYAIAVEDLYKREANKPHNHIKRLVSFSNTDELGQSRRFRGISMRFGGDSNNGKSDGGRLFNVIRMGRILSRLIHKNVIVDEKRLTSDNSTLSKKEQETSALHLIFLWAVCLDKFELARMFWLRGDQSILNALIASRLLSALSRHTALSGAHLQEEREKMIMDSKSFEALAIGVVDECYNDDTLLTQKMLHLRHPLFRWDAVRMAYETNALRFLSHTATQSVVSNDWNGGLKLIMPFWQVVLAYFVPFLVLPFYDLTSEAKQDQDDERERQTGSYFKGRQDEGEVLSPKSSPSAFWSFLSVVGRFYSSPYIRYAPSECLVELLFIILFGSLSVEEGRQLLIAARWEEYIADTWNRLDVASILLYFVGLAIRLTDLHDERSRIVTKTVHAFLAVNLWLRLMRYYAVDHNLGPKLIMMAEMTKDVTTFVFLLLIFLVGYGVAAQVLLFPQTPFTEEKFVNVLFKPYFQIYGELFIDDINNDSGCVGFYPFSACGRDEVRILPIFLAIYVLITNILLVNLLIAMFNDTYTKVQEDAEALWRQQNYELYLENVHRPLLPAPFILISHIRRAYSRWVHGPISSVVGLCRGCCPTCMCKACCCSCAAAQSESDDTQQLNTSGVSLGSSSVAGVEAASSSFPRHLIDFEEHNADRFVAKQERERNDSVENCVRTTRDGMDKAHQLITAILEHVVAFRSANTSASVTVMRPTDNGMEETRPGRMRAGVFDKPRLHYLPPEQYPGSNGVKRFVIDPSQVPWDVECPSYEPVEYTAPNVAAQPEWADPADPRKIKFNAKDKVEDKVVDRTSCHRTKFHVDEDTGRPINPWGRTGMTGRGNLGKWGVNQAADTVVTRWKRSPDGSILERDGKKVLEFVAIQRKDNSMWAIPGGFVDNGEDVALTSGREFMEEALGTKDKRTKLSEEEESSVASLFADGTIVGRIYSEDPRNTDNAWVETTCINFHDDAGRRAAKLKLQGGDDAKKARWMMVHGGLKLFASHLKLLTLVADSLNAYM
ncbi:hypothetical protein PTSG_05446 [Salpingoeca rosetta]|uniref:Nudix hydrolase domain-containing protein n=1 Tax=Salpingoeca rosetta (strain ATCC 50818 / BSB-021) TaxID=946362 RepID=F2UB86_SALR5|nr:uncharacterized protein PTSG_05446 [Salpingoeca rosetta]EGD73752.1 hypothetical protein PTSG_05446 [Salpingoeca rosetta]|eukprot:XP_004993315.1 hypothetical protein PTSG_05446 [Salpingoeca rosetta]